VLINSIIFTALVASERLEVVNAGWGVNPADIRAGGNLLSLFTAMFLHMDYIHLLGNMIFLLVFGWLLEPKLGPKKFLVIYLLSGLAASVFLVAATAESGVSVGASAAISGIAGVCLIMCSRDKIPMAFAFFLVFPALSSLIFINVRLTAVPYLIYFFLAFVIPSLSFIFAPARTVVLLPFLIIWVLLQLGDALALAAVSSASLHMAGFLIGLVAALLLRPRIRKEQKWADEIPAIR
jgi:membrane associated rhomboid family serine protease